MTTAINVPAELADELAQFFKDESIDLTAATDESAGVTIAPTGHERRESTLETLYVGGSVSCETGRALAKKLGIEAGDLGKLLDRVNVKVRACVLGCFE